MNPASSNSYDGSGQHFDVAVIGGGQGRHRRGVTDVPGLYFLGLTWQHTRGSALIGFIKDDAEFIAAKIAGYRQSTRQAQAGTPAGAGAAGEARSSERS